MQNKFITLKECEKKIHSLPYGSSAKNQLLIIVKEIKKNLRNQKDENANIEYIKNKNDTLFKYLRNSIIQLDKKNKNYDKKF